MLFLAINWFLSLKHIRFGQPLFVKQPLSTENCQSDSDLAEGEHPNTKNLIQKS